MGRSQAGGRAREVDLAREPAGGGRSDRLLVRGEQCLARIVIRQVVEVVDHQLVGANHAGAHHLEVLGVAGALLDLPELVHHLGHHHGADRRLDHGVDRQRVQPVADLVG